MFWKGKDMFCLEDVSHLAVSFVRKLGQFFSDTNPPQSMGNIFLGCGAYVCCDLYSPSNYDEATRKFRIGRFGRFEFWG